MKENSENAKGTQNKRRRSPVKISAIAAAVLALIQSCLTIEGMGIEGFALWLLLLILFYWLLFTFLIWLWRRLGGRK